jgi:hypothetical protein
MNVDLDTFYAEFLALKERVEPLFALLANRSAGTIVPPGKDQAAGLLEQGALDAAGAALGIHRVSKQAGHAFDEDDGSFYRRLMAEVFGAEAAGATAPRPASAQGDIKEYSSAEELDAILNQPEPTDVKVNDDGSVSKLRTDGPTIAEFVAAGFSAKFYPPSGYTSKSTQEEIDAAIAAEKPAGEAAERVSEQPNGSGVDTDEKPAETTDPANGDPSAPSGVNTDAPPVGPGNETN